jgi:uncharacterized MAPEG superfamily protein
MTNQTPELTYVALSAALTGSLWIPIVLNRFYEIGVWSTLKNPQRNAQPHADWAYRLASAHRNGVENLVVFAPLALAVHALGVGAPMTALACALYFWSRVAHAVNLEKSRGSSASCTKFVPLLYGTYSFRWR